MSQAAVIRLVKSLSKVEKRQFKLSTKKQTGNKDYLDLFDIIDRHNFPDTALMKEKFGKSHPDASLDNTARYLMKVLTECLIQSKIKDDSTFQLFQGLMRVRLLQERSLPEEGNKELKKLQEIATTSQNHLIQYMIYREELDYLSNLDFPGLSEKNLIDMQMKSRDVLKNMRNTHEQHSLYEILKYRLIHSGKVLSEVKKKQLNDLILSEMGLVTGRVKYNFESRKLHLLFQSFFFTDIGDYKSALKTFSELNKLFEQNSILWSHPPLDYLSALDGILDSLRTIGYFEEIPFYLDKMNHLDAPFYPEYFRFMVRKSILIYRITIYTGDKDYKKAVEYVEKMDPVLLKAYRMVDDEKQNELLFALGLAYFGIKDFKKAQKYMTEIVLIGKPNYQSVIYRASRLLNILIDYENNSLEYLDYEIRSYKRAFQNKENSLKIEKLIFKTLKSHPDIKTPQKNKLLWEKIVPLVRFIEKDKYETQLHKYFDFIGWVKEKYGK